MKPSTILGRAMLGTLVIAAGAAWPIGPASAQHMDEHPHAGQEPAKEAAMGHSHEMAQLHGGSVTMTPTHHFELLCTPKEARLYVYDDHQAPLVNLEHMKASMMLQEKAGKPMTVAMTYVKPDPAHGRSQGFFSAAHDFSGVAKNAVKAVFTIEGLAEKPVEFKSALSLGEEAIYACPMHADVTGEDPGRCSKCGMKLEKMSGHMAGGHGHEAGESPHQH